MRLSGLAVFAATLMCSLCLAGPPASAAGATYYLALGDSLSVGVQPGQGSTDEGYTDLVRAALKAEEPGLRLVKLGCGGETTTTMLKGGICGYPAGSQLKAAEDFLREHAGQVRYVTLNIGANNTACMLDGDIACGLRGAAALVPELPEITARLRSAGGDKPAYAAMTYYDPGLAAWVTGDAGKATAVLSLGLVDVFNAWETAVYTAAAFKVADVNGAFGTHDFTTEVTAPPYGEVPLNVARICAWTYQCTHNDGHATSAGYQQIAGTFMRALT